MFWWRVIVGLVETHTAPTVSHHFTLCCDHTTVCRPILHTKMSKDMVILSKEINGVWSKGLFMERKINILICHQIPSVTPIHIIANLHQRSVYMFVEWIEGQWNRRVAVSILWGSSGFCVSPRVFRRATRHPQNVWYAASQVPGTLRFLYTRI